MKSFAATRALVACGLVSSFARAQAAPAQDDVEIRAETTPAKPPPSSPPPNTAPPTTPLVPAAAPAPNDDVRADVAALRDEVKALREAQEKPHAPFLEIWDGAQPSTTPWETPGRTGLWLTGYMQSQYESHQDSQDQLAPGGVLVNQDRFLVRRARLKLIGEWQWAATQIELNGDTTKGFNVNLHHAEATLHYRPDPTKVPIAQATVGLFDTPFGYELVESPRSRPFMERTAMSRAFWPGEPDLGLRLSGGLSFFRWTVAAVNGHPLGDKQYPGQDPIGAKDVIFRFGVDTKPRPDLGFSADVSVLKGKGFHPGTDATKGTVEWHDLNEDGIVQPYELQGVAPASPTPSKTFDHWALGLDVQASYHSALGRTKLYGELVVAQNMDRATFIADPVLTSTDVRELGWYVGVLQDVTEHGIVGFRFDSYDPNSDVFDKRGGKLLPYSQAIKTFSPMVGLVLPQRAKLLFEYDVIRNSLARDASGVPANLKQNTATLRLQVEL